MSEDDYHFRLSHAVEHAQSVQDWIHKVPLLDSSSLIESSPPSPLANHCTTKNIRRSSSLQTSQSQARVTITQHSGLKRSRSETREQFDEVEAFNRMAPRQKDVSLYMTLWRLILTKDTGLCDPVLQTAVRPLSPFPTITRVGWSKSSKHAVLTLAISDQ